MSLLIEVCQTMGLETKLSCTYNHLVHSLIIQPQGQKCTATPKIWIYLKKSATKFVLLPRQHLSVVCLPHTDHANILGHSTLCSQFESNVAGHMSTPCKPEQSCHATPHVLGYQTEFRWPDSSTAALHCAWTVLPLGLKFNVRCSICELCLQACCAQSLRSPSSQATRLICKY